jgi:hypothetical protein
MIFGILKCSIKLEIYFGVYVGIVSRRESVYINIVWTVMYTAIYLCENTTEDDLHMFFDCTGTREC